MRMTIKLAACALVCALSTAAGAATLSKSPISGRVPTTPTTPAGTACGTTTLTQSTAQTITPLNSVSCNNGVGHTDNSYFRAFPSSVIPTGFAVCSVQVGVEQATPGTQGGTQPVTVNIYSHTGAAFPLGTNAIIGTNTVQLADQSGTIVDIALTGTVAAGADLVVEVFTPDGTTAGNLFFIGSNNAGESAPSYLEAADCGITTPTTTTAIGFPDMQFVMNVRGTPQGGGGTGNLTITPSSAPFGNQAVGSTSTPQTVTLANTGTASLDVTALTAPAAPFARSGGTCSNTLPITIAASASCTLMYTFAPTSATTSNQTLTVTANAPGSGTIALSGTGTQGVLTITPNGVDFGSQLIGTTSGVHTVTLANTGSSSLDVTGLTAAATPFARVTGTCSATLPITIAAGSSCTLAYTFTPTGAGPVAQTLTVTTNGLGSGPLVLQGNGAASVPALSRVGMALLALMLLGFAAVRVRSYR